MRRKVMADVSVRFTEIDGRQTRSGRSGMGYEVEELVIEPRQSFENFSRRDLQFLFISQLPLNIRGNM